MQQRITPLSREDYEMLLHLSSVYHAAVLSATDPVVVLSDAPVSGLKSAFSHIFYDNTDDERVGMNLMRIRRQTAAQDVALHLRAHRSLVEGFETIEEGLAKDAREQIVAGAQRVYHTLENYGTVVRAHKARTRDASFLEYPHCIPGHYFQVPGTEYLAQNVFNPAQTYQGLEGEIEFGRNLTESFSYRDTPLRGVRLTDERSAGAGLLDSSLAGRLLLTREMLRRAGFTNVE